MKDDMKPADLVFGLELKPDIDPGARTINLKRNDSGFLEAAPPKTWCWKKDEISFHNLTDSTLSVTLPPGLVETKAVTLTLAPKGRSGASMTEEAAGTLGQVYTYYFYEAVEAEAEGSEGGGSAADQAAQMRQLPPGSRRMVMGSTRSATGAGKGTVVVNDGDDDGTRGGG